MSFRQLIKAGVVVESFAQYSPSTYYGPKKLVFTSLSFCNKIRFEKVVKSNVLYIKRNGGKSAGGVFLFLPLGRLTKIGINLLLLQ